MDISLTVHKNDLVVGRPEAFDLDEILDCGQCFRWEKQPDGSWKGIVNGKRGQILQTEDSLIFYNTTREDFQTLWRGYFDFDRDYRAIQQELRQDPVMCKAIAFCPGIRILKQDPWEALCSFILSQNNNIKRIKGLVSRLCEHFGKPIDGGFSFPTPQRLAACTCEDLSVLRSGFRAKYLLDAARKVQSGELNLSTLDALPLEQARAQLQTIHGVGPKVADCALLYGFGRMDCLPMDVWIKRAVGILYPHGLPDVVTRYRGIAGQYLFHYARCCDGSLSCVSETDKAVK